MVYEKKCLMKAGGSGFPLTSAESGADDGAGSAMDIDVDSCNHCQRPKTKVKCVDCGHVMDNCRVKKLCPNKHKHLFLMDLDRCPKCHGPEIVEMEDDGFDLSPVRKIGFRPSLGSFEGLSLSFHERLAAISEGSDTEEEDLFSPAKIDKMIDQQSKKLEKLSLESDDTSSGSENSPRSSKPAPEPRSFFSLAGRGRGRGRGKIVLVLNEEREDMPVPSAPPAECICFRGNKLVVCMDCGSTVDNAKKNMPCLAHPGVATGDIEKCGECGALVDALDEYDYKSCQ